MSAAAPLRRPAALRLPAPARTIAAPKATTRPRLVLISQRRTTAGRLPFMIVVGGVLSIGLVSVLLLHMVAAQDAYRANALQQRLATLTDQEQQLATALDADSSPAALRQRASALGMRPTTVTSFRQLKDGRAIGVQTPVYPPPPVTQPSTSPKAGAKTTKAGAGAAGSKNAKTGKTAATGKTGTTTSKTTTTPKAGNKKAGTAGKTAPHHHKPATRP